MKKLITNNTILKGSYFIKFTIQKCKCIFVLLLFFTTTIQAQIISAGSAHSVFVCKNGNTANSSGFNDVGQLGDGTIGVDRILPVSVNGLTGVRSVAAGMQHTLALRSDSTVWAWGGNTNGQLGDGTNTNSTFPVKVNGLTGVIAISTGQAGFHSLALKANGTVWAWGSNSEGQLGDGTIINKNVPTQVTGLSNIIAIGGGEYHSLAVEISGIVWAWGDNVKGQIGDGTVGADRTSPVQVIGLTGITSVKGGRFFSIALKNDSTVYTWGENVHGQLGDGTLVDKSLPLKVLGLPKITAIAGGAFHALAIKKDSTLVAWGRNDHGMLGNGTTTPTKVSSPVAVNSLKRIIAIAGGTNFSLAVKDNDSTFAWGRNANGQLADGTINTPINSPKPVLSLCATIAANANNTRISAGSAHSVFLCNNDSTVNTSGFNDVGQLGDGTIGVDRILPVTVNGLTGVRSVAAGLQHTLALRNDSTVWAWGGNTNGQLGNGTNTNSDVPVKVNGLTGIIAISTGQAGYHSLALKANGTVWAWGSNSEGQLGDGTIINKNVPTQVMGLSNIIAIGGGEYHSLAIKNNRTVWAWGDNVRGQIGDGTVGTDRTSPVQVIGLTGITSVKGGRFFSIALKNDSTVYTWGENVHGQLGDGTLVDKSLPLKVLGLPKITAIAGGAFHVLAIKKDSTLVAWGRNDHGMLGNGTTTPTKVTSPVAVNSLKKIVAIAGGTNFSLAVKDNDSTFAWGRNANGQLADGTINTPINSPKPVLSLCSDPTSVDESKNASYAEILFFPNPSSDGKFQFLLNSSVQSLEIYNMLGEKLFHSITNNLTNGVIDISNQPNGIYFITIKSAEHTFYQKLVKQ